MSVQIYPYTTPAVYTYDTNKIEVSGGLATLKEDLTDVYTRWHLNALGSGDNVEDSSGNNRDGTAVGTPSVVAGQLNNCFQFNGTTQYINCGDIADFERTDAFSIEIWIKMSSSIGTLVSRRQGAPTYKGWLINNTNGQIGFGMANSNVTANRVLVRTVDSSFNDNAWHQVIITYDGSSSASGIKIYVDANSEALTTIHDALTASIMNVADCNIGSYNNGTDKWNGLIDETLIYDKELSQAEVTYRYNTGTGREDWYHYSDKPTIEPTDLFDPASVYTWDAFLETLGGGNVGSIGYNLYKVNKTNKYYWNGSAWVTGGDSSNYNTIATVNSNIASFDGSPDKIGFVAYLISTGEQVVELSENQITYTVNQNPLVNAGTDKACNDNQSISPFSDCSFSDPDGTVVRADYKVDGEVDVWTEIPQGGYGSLLEAVQAWSYTFNVLGSKTVRLQVTDDASGAGATANDSLIVTVSKYTRTVNIKDSVTGAHLQNVLFNPGDGTGPAYQDSPFSYSWEYGSFDITMTKSLYNDRAQTISVSDETDLNLTISEEDIINQCLASVGLITETDTVAVSAWLSINGQVVTSPTSCEIWLYDNDEILEYHPAVNYSPEADGVFNFSLSPSLLPDDQIYHLKISVISGGITYDSVVAVGQIKKYDRKLEAIPRMIESLRPHHTGFGDRRY